MSYPILSSTVQWRTGFKRTPRFNVVKQTPVARRGIVTAALMPYPTYDFEVDLIALGSIASPSSVLAQFQGLYMATQGGAALWLFNDINDNTVASSNSGMFNVTPSAAVPMGLVGDGVSTQFQLGRQVGGMGWDIIQQLNGSPSIYLNGTLTSAYSISGLGVVTFTSAPASGATLTWNGSFYFPCMFDEDTLGDLALIGFNSTALLWQCTAIKFSSVFQ